MRKLLLLLPLLCYGQTSNYPGTLDNDRSLFVTADNVQSTLSAAATAGDTSLTVGSGTGFATNQIATICDTVTASGKCTVFEHMLITGVAGSVLTVTRGFAGTSARSHARGATISILIDAAHQQAIKDALIKIETALGANLSNVGVIRSNAYIFTPQLPGGSLVAGNNAVTLAPVPSGVNGSDSGHYLYVSGGTGTAENCLITGGSATAGALSGQVIINCANSHSGAWSIQSATAGIQEAVIANPNGGPIGIPTGTTTILATVSFGAWHQFVGTARGDTGGGTVIDATAVTGPAFKYLSAVQGSAYDVNSGIVFADLAMTCKTSCIQVNAETIPTYQGNIKNPEFRHIRLFGSYAAASDGNRYTATVPTLSELRAFGTGISCNQCFDALMQNVQVENFGIGVYEQGDLNVIDSGSRFARNATDVWLDGASGFNANTNKVINSEFLASRRVASIRLTGAQGTMIANNYFETYCPSAQYVRSTAGIGTMFYSNRMDDPANAAGCVLQGGPSTVTTTPILYLDDYNSDQIWGNFMNIGGGAVPPIAVAYNNWNTFRPNFVSCRDNNQFFPCPDGRTNQATAVFYALAPGVVSGQMKPYTICANNVAGDVIAGASATSFAAIWKQSSVLKQADNSTGRWVLSTGSSYAFVVPVQSLGYSVFSVRFTGRRIGTGAGGYSVQYTDAAGTTTTLATGNLSFTATTEVEVKTASATLPGGAVGWGKFSITVDGSNAEFEQIEIVPVS